MMPGSDGGITVDRDGGRNWDYINNIPIGQFYEIAYDMEKPYNLCGGLQDNNSWCGPSGTRNTRGTSNDEWFTVSGGDGFYARIDPTGPRTSSTPNRRTAICSAAICAPANRAPSAHSKRTTSAALSLPVEFAHATSRNSTTRRIYYGGNYLFKSTDRGDSWERLGPDLTTGIERDKLPILGKVPDKDTLSRHDGVQQFPCITTISESPKDAKVLWAGTDDGNVQVTRDGGKNWTNVVSKIPGVRKGAYVSRIEASHFDAGVAYVAFDNHRSDDYSVYLYTTSRLRRPGRASPTAFPHEAGTVHVVREDPANRNLLFAGPEFGLFVSFNRGTNWQRMNNGLSDSSRVRHPDSSARSRFDPRHAWTLALDHGRHPAARRDER